MANCGNCFDLDIVRAFMEKIEFFPIGSFVELSNKQKAVVINNDMPLRPIVKLIEKPYSTLDLFSDTNTFNVTIVNLYNDIPMSDLTDLTQVYDNKITRKLASTL